jgi:hypothetical protein
VSSCGQSSQEIRATAPGRPPTDRQGVIDISAVSIHQLANAS